MRHPKKTYPKVFSIFFGLLAAALILFLGWLSFQPTQLEEPSRTEDTKSDPADESSSAFSGQESDIEVSQSSASLEPASDDGSLDTFVDWVIWYAEQEPQFPVKEDGSTVYGELFGDPYAQWCAEFLMYCLKKAEDRLGTSYIDSVYPWYPAGFGSKRIFIISTLGPISLPVEIWSCSTPMESGIRIILQWWWRLWMMARETRSSSRLREMY